MRDKAKSLATLPDDKLVRDRINRFFDDADWRSKCVGGMEKYNELNRLYESTGVMRGSDNIPDMGNIREAVDDAISVAIANIPKVKLKASDPISTSQRKEVRDVLMAAQRMTVKVMNLHVRTQLLWNQFADLRSHALRQAGIYGSGNIYIRKTPVVQERRHFQARRLAHKDLAQWDEEDWKTYRRLRSMIYDSFVDAADVFWQHGIADPFSDEMKRVTILSLHRTNDLKAQYPDKADRIRSGRSTYYIDSDPRANNRGTTTGVITTYEREDFLRIKQLGPEGAPEASATFHGSRMIKTVVANGNVLLEREVFDSNEHPIILPVVPYYLMTSERHPYGFPLTTALEPVQKFLNYLYLQVFQQGSKAVSPQTVFMNLAALGATDSIEEWEEKLEDGGIIPVEGPEDNYANFDIRKYIQNARQVAEPGLSNAYKEMITLAEQQFQRKSQMPDREAISSARSGLAKSTEIAVADRTKSPMIDALSRSEEAVWDLHFQNVQTYQREPQETVLELPEGEQKTVTLNDRKTVPVPLNDEQGWPVMNPARQTEENPFGFDYELVEIVENNTQTEMTAISEGRGVLPVSWMARVQALASLYKLSALKSPRTIADMGLPEEIQAADEQNFKQDQQQREQALRKELEMQQEFGGQEAKGQLLPAPERNPNQQAAEGQFVPQEQPAVE